ncbi:hypothetical protein ACQKFM_00610 [Paenibacillus xylanexedens]|uniref:hypothetical protein n=1 Tax=Paenibacillus xylanexedens TaxID=528191 RepID=UPI003D0506BA
MRGPDRLLAHRNVLAYPGFSTPIAAADTFRSGSAFSKFDTRYVPSVHHWPYTN